MGTVKLDIVVRQGATFELTVQARNADGTVKDLTGYTGRMQIRPYVDSTDVLLDAVVSGTITITSAQGIVAVSVPANITAAMDWSSGVYDLEVFSSAANVIRLVEGNASFSKEVTR